MQERGIKISNIYPIKISFKNSSIKNPCFHNKMTKLITDKLDKSAKKNEKGLRLGGLIGTLVE